MNIFMREKQDIFARNMVRISDNFYEEKAFSKICEIFFFQELNLFINFLLSLSIETSGLNKARIEMQIAHILAKKFKLANSWLDESRS